jgi:hypothetical protein
MKQMAFTIAELDASTVICVVVHSAKAPSEDEWEEYMRAVRQNEQNLPRVRTIVFTDGGGPNSAQRKAINDFLRGRQTPVVLASTSPVVRGITTALSWFNPLVKSVAPDDLEGALRHLGVQPYHRTRVLQEMRKLRAELGQIDLKSMPR